MMRIRTDIGILFLLFVLTFCGVPFGSLSAATGLTIQPVKVSHTISPGQTVSGSILISNASSVPVIVSTKVEDFIPLAGSNTIQFTGRAPGVTTVSDWITINSPESFEFALDEKRTVSYTITAPADAEPGSHFGVIFFKATDLAVAGEQLKVGTQVGMLVFVTVPGDFVQTGKVLGFTAPKFSQKPPINLDIKYENTGTVHFEPKGYIEIANVFGKKVSSIPVEGQVVLPTGIKDITVAWSPVSFVLGRYTAALYMNDNDGNPVLENTLSFYVIPLWYTLEFIIALILIFFILKFLQKKVKISIVK